MLSDDILNTCLHVQHRVITSEDHQDTAYLESELLTANINMGRSSKTSNTNTQHVRRQKKMKIRNILKKITEETVIADAIKSAKQEQIDKDRHKQLVMRLTHIRKVRNKRINRVKTVTKYEVLARKLARK